MHIPHQLVGIGGGILTGTDEILRRIYVCKIYNTSHLEMIIQDLGKSIEEYKAKLVIIDSYYR